MIRIVFSLAALAAVLFAPVVRAEPADDLHLLFDDYYRNGLRENPLAATFRGVSDYNDRLPSVAAEDHARRAAQDAAFLDRLHAIDRAALSDEDQVNYDLFDFIVKHDVARAEFRPYRIPYQSDSGFWSGLARSMQSVRFRDKKDYDDYIARLNAIPGYFDQHIENMRAGARDGFTAPQVILSGLAPSIAAFVKEDPKQSAYYAPFQELPETMPRRTRNRLQREAAAAIAEKVDPAYARLSDFFVNEYMPAARTSLGASDLPDGRRYYAGEIRYYTTLDEAAAEDIHALGLREVARIKGEMEEIIESLGFEGSFAEFLEFLRTDPQFYAETEEDLLKEAAWIAKRVDGVMPAFFGKLPRQPYGIEAVPAEIAPNYTTGRYVGAPLGATRGGYYWVNTYNLKQRPLYNLTALTLHEAVPGHHHQSALSKEIENVPEFRKGFYPHAFGEGWGLYSEKLGIEMGVYDDAYENFGRLSYEMWRACRLVIDTGIHSKGWTRDQALDYMASNTALSMHNVRTEIDRYIAWPGQALAYKMGELTILELRAKAERELGADFDIREFHDAVLAQGGMPLEILRRRIDAYIEARQAN